MPDPTFIIEQKSAIINGAAYPFYLSFIQHDTIFHIFRMNMSVFGNAHVFTMHCKNVIPTDTKCPSGMCDVNSLDESAPLDAPNRQYPVTLTSASLEPLLVHSSCVWECVHNDAHAHAERYRDGVVYDYKSYGNNFRYSVRTTDRGDYDTVLITNTHGLHLKAFLPNAMMHRPTERTWKWEQYCNQPLH